jgi:hypothetical protein
MFLYGQHEAAAYLQMPGHQAAGLHFEQALGTLLLLTLTVFLAGFSVSMLCERIPSGKEQMQAMSAINWCMTCGPKD